VPIYSSLLVLNEKPDSFVLKDVENWVKYKDMGLFLKCTGGYVIPIVIDSEMGCLLLHFKQRATLIYIHIDFAIAS
jgi:hypothetical protein